MKWIWGTNRAWGRLALAATLLAFGARAAAPPPFQGRASFRFYGENEGLANLSVESLLQDREGYLWAGTQDGVYRFDGLHFLRFGQEQGLPNSWVTELVETPAGLYAATFGGLARFDGSRFVALGAKAGLPTEGIGTGTLAVGPGGKLYVGAATGLFVSAEGDRFVPTPLPGGGPVTAVHVTARGVLWVARGAALYRVEGGTARDVGETAGLQVSEAIQFLLTDAQGTLWIRTQHALWKLPSPEARAVRDDAGVPPSAIHGRLALGESGQLMVPTEHGLALRTPSGFTLIGAREGLVEGELVLCSLLDREGSLWMGVVGVGLAHRLGSGAFVGWTRADGLPSDVVWAIARERRHDGRPAALWVGTQEGLARIDGGDGSVRPIAFSPAASRASLHALIAGDDGDLWAGSFSTGGVYRIAPDGRLRQTYGAKGVPLGDFRIHALAFAPSGDLWAGTVLGVYRLPRGKSVFEPVPLPEDPHGSHLIVVLAVDREGDVWAGGPAGLLRMTGPLPKRFNKASGLRGNAVVSIGAVPGSSELVVGFIDATGVDRVSPVGAELSVTALESRLPAPAGNTLIAGYDQQGDLWLGGPTLIMLPREGPGRVYGNADGMLSQDVAQNSFLAEADGSVWLGTSRGLMRWRPGAQPLLLPPPASISMLRIGTEPARTGSARVRLPAGVRDLSVGWAALSFRDPQKIRFRYRLSSADADWRQTSASEAEFPDLHPGNYKLEVTALAPDGAKSAAPATLEIEVVPAFWESGLVRAAAAAALLLVLLLAAAWFKWRSDRAQAALRAAIAERDADLAQADLELEEMSFSDPLTGCRNRRFFEAAIEQDTAQTQRAHADPTRTRNRDLLFFLVDLDHFKRINDTFGRGAGDAMLKEVGARLQAAVRLTDLVVRWGGQEFLLMARGSERADGELLATRILSAVGDRSIDIGEGRTFRATCSVGWAPLPARTVEGRAKSHDIALALAEKALQLAKRSGRNRAVGVQPLAEGVDFTATTASLLDLEGASVMLLQTAGPQQRSVSAG